MTEEFTTYSYISNHLCFEYFVCGEISKFLGYKSTDGTAKLVSKCNQLPFREYPGVREPRLRPNTILITRDGVIEILLKTRKLITPDIANILKQFGIELTNRKCLTKEQDTLSEISKAFKIEKMETQYPVGPYFLDLYFPDYKIVVECDELGHFDRDQDAEKKRVDYINVELGIDDTHWARFNPDSKDFDISKVVGEIYILLSRLKEEKVSYRSCMGCQKEKLTTDFYKSDKYVDGFHKRCIACMRETYRRWVDSKDEKEISVINKVCIECNIEKKRSQFYVHANNKDSLSSRCTDCTKQGREKLKMRAKTVPAFKKCRKCKETKCSNDFGVRSVSADGLSARCKQCVVKYSRVSKPLPKSKQCSRCGEEKDAKEFYATSAGGLAAQCKKCVIEKSVLSKKEKRANKISV